VLVVGFGWALGLKGDFEVEVLGIDGDFFYFCISYIAGKGALYFPDAVVDICIRALSKHLHSAIRAVADEAGQLVAIGYVKSSETKTDSLDSADENYMFGALAHYPFYIKPSLFSLQVCVLSVDNTRID
jgi:hypothetical protein